MKKALAIAAVALMAAARLPAAAEETMESHPADHGQMEANAKTITGEVIDITCYLRHDLKGEEHIKCAAYCAGLGMPLGLLADDSDRIYLIVPSGHADPKEGVLDHIGKRVKVEGLVHEAGGLTSLQINKIVAL